MFESIVDVVRSRRPSTQRDLGFAVYRHGKNQIKGHIVLGSAIMKKAKILPGDTVDVLRDKDGNLGLIRRVTGAGLKVSNGSSKAYCTVHITNRKHLPTKPHGIRAIENVVVSDEGILFDWPAK